MLLSLYTFLNSLREAFFVGNKTTETNNWSMYREETVAFSTLNGTPI